MKFVHTLMLTALVGACLASPAGAIKIFINPSDQIHNVSPDKTYCEADNMQDVARRLESKLKARGFDVMNSNGDTMAKSVAAANEWPADVFVSIHSNASGGPAGWHKAHGTNTLYYLPRDGSGANPISMRLARMCDDKCVEKFTTYGRGHDFGCVADLPFLNYNLYVLRRTKMPGTLVEGLFHDNEEDTAVLKTEEGRDAYAQAVYEALCDYAEMSYYPDAPILDPVGPVANDSEGRLTLAARGDKGNVRVIRQTGINGAWLGEWLDLGGALRSEPVLARNAQGRLHVFAGGPGGRIWHKVQASAGSDRWNGWYDLGGKESGYPVIARNTDGRLAVFAVGRDCHLRYRVQTGLESALAWDAWHDMGRGPWGGTPAVSPQADGRLVVVCRNQDGYLRWTVQTGDGKWEKWHDVDDQNYGHFRLVRDASGRLALFCEGAGGRVLCKIQSAPNSAKWDAWQDLGGSYGGSLAVGTNTDGRLELFGRDSEGKMHRNAQETDGKWSGWKTIGDTYTYDPMVGRNKDGRIELFARDKDEKMMYRVQREPSKSAVWDGWYTLGEKPEASQANTQ